MLGDLTKRFPKSSTQQVRGKTKIGFLEKNKEKEKKNSEGQVLTMIKTIPSRLDVFLSLSKLPMIHVKTNL